MALLQKIILDFGSRLKYKRYGKLTLRDMLAIADIPETSLEESILPLLNHPIKQICYARKRMVPDSLAIVSYGGPYPETPKAIEKAVAGGAVALIVKEAVPGVPCIVVPKPLHAYANLCGYFRGLYPSVRSTAITGSIGKTTVKYMVDAVYREKYRTLTEPTNDNQPEVIGFTAQHLSKHIDRWIQEVAESIPESAKEMSLILKPNVVIITTIDNSHIGRLGGIDTIFNEICDVTKDLSAEGIVIIKKEEILPLSRLKGKRIITVSTSDPSADYYAGEIEVTVEGLKFLVYEKDGKSVQIHLHDIYAVHNVLNALYAYAAGRFEGMTPEEVAAGLEKFKTTGYRNNVYKSFSGKDIIYADCYNAVGRSIHAALEASAKIPLPESGKRVVILGDVQELGDRSAEEHLHILQDVNQSCFDILILKGDFFHEAAKSFSFRKGLEVKCLASNHEIEAELKPLLSKGNLFLFKASHSGHLEECIQKLWPKEYMQKEREELKKKNRWKFQLMLP